MGDLVLGLAKSAVEGTLVKAKSAINEEAKLQHSVQRDLIFITDEFQMMHSFLNVIDKERAKDIMVRTWLRQVLNLAYNVDDGIEFVVHLDKKSAWWQRWVPSCMAPALPLDEAAAEIKQLKARVEDVNQRTARYSLMSDDSGSNPLLQPDAPGAAAFDIISEVWEAARRQRGELTELITGEDNNLQVISLWGTGGNLGMTSIIRNMYNDNGIIGQFPRRAWAKVMHPFNPDDFLISIVIQFRENYSGGRIRMNDPVVYMRDFFKDFRQQVEGQRYLVVVEDISTMEEWDAIRKCLAYDNKASSRIIVSTQQWEMASLCTGWPYQVSELKQFSSNHSICAFFKKGSRHDGGSKKLEEAQKWLDEFKLVGHDQVQGIFKYGHMVRPVCGIAGVGKSTLVRRAYYKHMLDSFGPDRPGLEIPYAWVDVSHPFNLRDFCRRLLFDFYSDEPQVNNNVVIGMNAWLDPIEECSSLLCELRCVIVIDSLQSTEEWDLIEAALLSEHTQSTIVVITTEASVATHCVDGKYSVFNVKYLQADKALELFEQALGDSFNWVPEEERKHMVTKCGGLPKVIVDIARYLANAYSKGEWRVESMAGWRVSLMGKLETNPSFDSLRDLFAWMHSYFHACPDPLKPCIIYLLVFPAEHNTRRRRLLRRWIAEGYCWDTDGNTAEENGEKFFSMLIDLSIIQRPPATLLIHYSKAMVQYQVNSFFHEYIISRSVEDNLVFALEGCCSLNSQRTGRHLTVWSSWDRDRNVFQSIDFSRLRSLTVFGKWESFFISANMRRLWVLDLEDTSGVKDDDLKLIGKLLPRLKFLSLRGCIEISRLPSSLGCLRQLQTLDVTNTSIVTLPTTIIKLQKLQYIRAGNAVRSLDDRDGTSTAANQPAADDTLALCLSKIRRRRPVGSHNGGVEFPVGIENLAALHTLGVVNASAADGETILKELKNLTQLRKLRVSGINRENIQDFCSAISAHGHLESLSVQLDKDNELGCLDIILPPKNLQNLKLYGSVGKLPAVWIRQIGNLRKLTLKLTMLANEDIEMLHDLPNLVILRLFVNQFQDGELSLFPGHRGSFLTLEVGCTSSFLVTFEEQAGLEVLKLHCCSRSPVRFSGLDKLHRLKEISLKGSCRALECCSIWSVLSTKQELQRQLVEHPRDLVLKLE